MKKILVIDDAEFILESASTLLRFEGYEVYTAPDGEIGLEIIYNHKPDLVLCDISMPKLDGFGVLEKIRTDPEIESLPFIFLTAFTEKTNMRQGMDKGADDYLIKPYTRDELISAIDAQWNKHSRIEKQVQEKVDEVGRSVTYALPHEFRTVLNEVINSAKYLSTNSKDISSDEIMEISDDIVTSANRLLKITENFLIFAMIDTYLASPQKKSLLRTFKTEEPTAIYYDIATLKASNYSRIEDVKLLEAIEHLSIEISTDYFHKILDELIDNALKFSNPGSDIEIKTWLKNNEMFLSLRDYGRGMNNEQLSRISALSQFERSFYEQQGVGMGLVVAKKLVEIHDGSFFINSEEGVGTTIIISFHCTKL